MQGRNATAFPNGGGGGGGRQGLWAKLSPGEALMLPWQLNVVLCVAANDR